ncbi:MAG: DUF1801 domain-containing protein [Sphingomonadales bacterium]|nr:MAG: DUF1801 domain-containing protein [Sphingomonadales bacterium]
MAPDIAAYNQAQVPNMRAVCDALAAEIDRGLRDAESKVWHGGPVWFLAGNPIAGYWVRKSGVQLLFWSGQSFDEPGLKPEGKFKAAEAHYAEASEIDADMLQRWLEKARRIQWDYKNIVKRKGQLELLYAPTGK